MNKTYLHSISKMAAKFKNAFLSFWKTIGESSTAVQNASVQTAVRQKGIFLKSMNSLVKREQLCYEMIYSFHTFLRWISLFFTYCFFVERVSFTFTKCSVRTQKVRDLEKSCTFFLSLEHSCTWAWNNLHLAEKRRWASCVQKYISHGFSRRAPWLCQRQTIKYLFIFTLSSLFSAEYSTIGVLFNRHR